MAKYKEKITMHRATWNQIKGLEGIEDISMLDNDELDSLGAREDDESYAYVVKFQDGAKISLQLYSGSTNYWWDVYYDDDFDHPDVIDELEKTMIFEHPNGNTYEIEVEITGEKPAKEEKWIKFSRGSFATEEDWKTVCEECDADPETTQTVTIYFDTAVVIDELEGGN